MVCTISRPSFANPVYQGISVVKPIGDGTSVKLSWHTAYSPNPNLLVGYNVYFSSTKDDVFAEKPKFFTKETEITINQFVPGDMMYYGVRATLYDPDLFDLSQLPISDTATDSSSYVESILSTDISTTSTAIPLLDISGFPSFGVILVGSELITYFSADFQNNILHTTTDGRGTYGTTISSHGIDGYDGYVYWDPIIRFYPGFEEGNNIVQLGEPQFQPPEYAYTENDGYLQVTKDLITTDLGGSDASNENNPMYDYSGYHRTSILDYFSGKCVGSYAGGEYGCADGYKVRGMSLQTINMQRQEMLLQVTGESVVLLRRKWTGIRCKCFTLNNESPEARCPVCFGTGFVSGYDQYYNDRRSDRRILVRFDATVDDLAYKSHGLEQNFQPNAWTLTVPAIKDRDIIIRFNEDGTDEFRYEVLNVTRNKLLFSNSGSQKFQLQRLDRTDIVYQWRAIRSAANFPTKLMTTTGILRGHGPHMHEVIINEHISAPSQINQTTSTVAGHSHPIINGTVLEVLGHTHQIIIS